MKTEQNQGDRERERRVERERGMVEREKDGREREGW